MVRCCRLSLLTVQKKMSFVIIQCFGNDKIMKSVSSDCPKQVSFLVIQCLGNDEILQFVSSYCPTKCDSLVVGGQR